MVAEARLMMGSPVDQILTASEEIGAGLLIVGRRGLGGVKRLLMGSVSEGVVHHTRCPVLVPRCEDEAWPPSRLIMADDSSDDVGKSAGLGLPASGRSSGREARWFRSTHVS